MKKKITTLAMTLVAVMFLFTGCGWSTEDNTAIDSSESPFISISSDIVYGRHVEGDNRIFVYDKYTKVIFYLFSNYNVSFIEGDHTYTYFSEFINKNGNRCWYDEETNTVIEFD